MEMPIRVLILEDQPDDARLIVQELKRTGFELHWQRIETEEELRQQLEPPPDVILSDFSLPGWCGLDALRLVREQYPDIPFLFVSGTIGEDQAVAAMREGAADFLLKDRLTRLGTAIQQALERRRLREAKQRAERDAFHFAALVESSEDAIICTTLDGMITSWNPAAERLYGWSRAEAVGNPVTLVAPPDRKAEVPAILARIRQGERVEHFDTIRSRKDGSAIEVSVTISPVKDTSGQIIGVSAMGREVTAQKRLAAERDELLRRLQVQLERMPLAYILHDADFRIIDWNPAAERIFGYAREEILGLGPPFEKLLPPEAWPKVDAILRRIRSGDMAAHIINVNRTRDGQTITCEWYNTPLFGEDGRFGGLLCLAQDVTDRQQAEEQRSRLARHVDLLLQSTGEGLYGMDARGRCTFINRAAAEMLGYRPEEVVGREMHPLIHGCHKDGSPYPTEKCPIYRTFMHGEPVRVDRDVFWCKDGAGLPVDYSSHPVIENGVVRGAVVAFSDIRERQQLEEQYRQAQKMEAIGQLAGGVAHDFNNLLTIINGYSDLLLQRLPATDPMRELLEAIHSAGERSAALTRQLLAFSRKQVVAPRPLDLNAVVADTERILRRLIGEDVRLHTVLASGLGIIRADSGQLEQVLLNLAVNARDAMPRGGQLTLETRNADLDEAHTRMHPGARSGPHVLLAVSDTGCGMDRATLARIFEPFFTTKQAGKGTGLGLAVVHGIVKQAEGHIAVTSVPGVGTTFKLYFPRIQDQAPSGKSNPGLAALARGTETLLLVEDEDSVRALSRHVLQSCGYTVLEACHGEEALRIGTQHTGRIDLLLTDVVMPRLGGREVADQLAALHPETKVLFLSGYTDDAIVRSGIQEAEVAFLQKPFSPGALAQKVREVLNGVQ